MVEPPTDDELAILRAKRAEEDVAEQREKVARAIAAGKSTKEAEDQLTSLTNELELLKGRLADLTSKAKVYRCYLMRGDHIEAVRVLECVDDADVMTRAGELLDAMSEYQRIEIWSAGRLLGEIPRR
jgi:hypothetical protein